jgi:glycerol kinase
MCPPPRFPLPLVHGAIGASTVAVNATKPAGMSHLVIDVGTSNLRTVLVHPDGATSHERRAPIPAIQPFVGAVEFDPQQLAETVIALANATLRAGGGVTSIGITTQRASTIVWDRGTGVPVANGIGWQDLRTAGMCVMAGAMGKSIAPNQSATKAQFLFDSYDADRTRDLCFGTVDSWIIWTLTNGAEHAIEASNAAVTGLIDLDERGNVVWDDANVAFFRLPPSCLPRIVPSIGDLGRATALDGGPPITGVVGDQQSSLIGQSCVRPGMAKITFGTGAMFDMLVGPTRPVALARSGGGTFPIVSWADDKSTTFGLEAIDLAAG